MIFDLHCDTIFEIKSLQREGKDASLTDSPLLQLNEEKMKRADYLAQCFAMWIHAKNADPYHLCKQLIEVYEQEIKKCSHIKKAYTYADILRNKEEGKISSILTLEDAAPIGADLSRLDEFYQLGVRMICLTWNYENALAFPNRFHLLPDGKPDDRTPNTETGLTELGKEAVKKMNKLGIAVDVSHLSDKGFYDVLTVTDKPIVASHSNARACAPHIRNLTDDMLYKLAENGGITGMNYATYFLHEDKAIGRNTVPQLVRHIQYIKDKIGIDHIALGSDFDGISPDLELNSADKLPSLITALSNEGFTDTEIQKITSENALRVFRTCLQ